MHSFSFSRNRVEQRGAALLIMLIIIVIGFAATLLNSLSATAMNNARQAKNTETLAQARQALIGYAISYGDAHPGQTHGYLPCPDIDGSNGEGSSSLSCGSKNISRLGRLPWKSLELYALRDGDGECLWYAVSGTYKSNPKTDLLNWDTQGQLQVHATDGTTQLSLADSQIVAVIFSPGPSLTGQNRASSGNTAICGGNYTASNYLDNDLTHSINNAMVSALANAASPSITGPIRNMQGELIVNDRIAFITQNDLFQAIRKRNDFAGFVSSLLSTSTACLSALPAPVVVDFTHSPLTEISGGASVGSLEAGRVPKSCLSAPLHNWQDNLMYARCLGGTACLTVNGASCKGVVIFSGERNTPQLRASDIHKNDWNNYLEGAALTAFTTGATSFTGTSSYSAATPTADILACIP